MNVRMDGGIAEETVWASWLGFKYLSSKVWPALSVLAEYG